MTLVISLWGQFSGSWAWLGFWLVQLTWSRALFLLCLEHPEQLWPGLGRGYCWVLPRHLGNLEPESQTQCCCAQLLLSQKPAVD